MNAMCGIDDYRAPLGRTDLLMDLNPARWAGLRNHGPLARNVTGMSSPIPLQRESAIQVTAVKPARRASPAELYALDFHPQHHAFRGEL